MTFVTAQNVLPGPLKNDSVSPRYDCHCHRVVVYILCIASVEILAEYTKEGLGARRDDGEEEQEEEAVAAGHNGTIVLAAAGAAATTMHNDGLSAHGYCRAPQTVSSRRTAENSARARERPITDRRPPMDFHVRVNPAPKGVLFLCHYLLFQLLSLLLLLSNAQRERRIILSKPSDILYKMIK